MSGRRSLKASLKSLGLLDSARSIKRRFSWVRTMLAQPDHRTGRLERSLAKAKNAFQPAPRYGLLDSYALQRKLAEAKRRAEAAQAAGAQLSLQEREVLWGVREGIFEFSIEERVTPPDSVAFVTVANGKFVPGLEALMLSLVDVYPDLHSDVIVYHDGSITSFSQRRLRNIYPKLRFETPDMTWFLNIPNTSGNHKRIGALGYMNVMALKLRGYRRVVILDSDLLIMGDISALWRGLRSEGKSHDYVENTSIIACSDIGARPFVARSPVTGGYIINSGIFSIPELYCSDEHFNEIQGLAKNSSAEYCDLIDRFADQKIWNQFVIGKKIDTLPVNYNCNAAFVESHLGGQMNFVRVVHFTGDKPWFHPDYLNADEYRDDFRKDRTTHQFWQSQFRTLRLRHRSAEYRHYRQARPVGPSRKPTRTIEGKRACFFMGNGPSLGQTDLRALDGFERFAFNWFINHDAYDDIRPDHLVLGSHMLFGGWNTQKPRLPDVFLERLYSKSWRPKIWTSYYFKPYFEDIGLDVDFNVDYVLFEKPFKVFVDKVGSANVDLFSFMKDGRTGVLSVALPVAIEMGYEVFGLVGCDSNYNQTGNSNYFYDTSLHQSLSTREASLTNTWTEDGRGHYAYAVAQRQLEQMGMSMLDFTIGGSLPLPKREIGSLSEPVVAPEVYSQQA